VSAHKSSLRNFVNDLAPLERVIHFLADPCCDFAHETAKGHDVTFLNKPEAKTHAVPSLFRVVVVMGRVYQFVPLEFPANRFNLCCLTGPTVCAISVSVINGFQCWSTSKFIGLHHNLKPTPLT
jgi:hypothetical protein